MNGGFQRKEWHIPGFQSIFLPFRYTMMHHGISTGGEPHFLHESDRHGSGGIMVSHKRSRYPSKGVVAALWSLTKETGILKRCSGGIHDASQPAKPNRQMTGV